MFNKFLLLYIIKIIRMKLLILFYLKFYNAKIKRYSSHSFLLSKFFFFASLSRKYYFHAFFYLKKLSRYRFHQYFYIIRLS